MTEAHHHQHRCAWLHRHREHRRMLAALGHHSGALTTVNWPSATILPDSISVAINCEANSGGSIDYELTGEAGVAVIWTVGKISILITGEALTGNL